MQAGQVMQRNATQRVVVQTGDWREDRPYVVREGISTATTHARGQAAISSHVPGWGCGPAVGLGK